MDYKELKRLVELVENAGISHLSIDENGSKIEIKKELASQTSVVVPQAPTVAAPVKQAVVPRVAVPAAVAPQSSGSDLRVIDLNNVNIGDPDF